MSDGRADKMKQRREVAFVPDEAGEDFSSEVRVVLDINGDRQVLVIHLGESTQVIDLKSPGNRTGLEGISALIRASVGMSSPTPKTPVDRFLGNEKIDPELQPRSYEKRQPFSPNLAVPYIKDES